MKISCVSNLISVKKLREYFGFGPGTPGLQAQKYNRLLSQGLCAFADVENVSIPNISKRETKALSVDFDNDTEDGLVFNYVKAVNIPVIKNLIALLSAGKKVKKSDAIVCDLCAASVSLGALRTAKRKKIPAVGIVTDLPDFLSGGAGSKAFKKLFQKNLSLCDAFVLLTRQMSEYPGISGKPYAVVEGICESASFDTEKYEETTLVYAGGLEPGYGVDAMVKAFENVGIGRLVIFGKGSLEDFIRSEAAENSSIDFRGLCDNDVVVDAERRATLLVNPRRPEEEFTKYSFPSKNMEYMATGTPLLCYMLPGMPDEYSEYVIPCGDDFEESLKSALTMDKERLQAIGVKARAFVTSEKNSVIQAEKVIKLISEVKK